MELRVVGNDPIVGSGCMQLYQKIVEAVQRHRCVRHCAINQLES